MPTCTDEAGIVHALTQQGRSTYCDWARVWADGEWPINTTEKHVTCLECIANSPY